MTMMVLMIMNDYDGHDDYDHANLNDHDDDAQWSVMVLAGRVRGWYSRYEGPCCDPMLYITLSTMCAPLWSTHIGEYTTMCALLSITVINAGICDLNCFIQKREYNVISTGFVIQTAWYKRESTSQAVRAPWLGSLASDWVVGMSAGLIHEVVRREGVQGCGIKLKAIRVPCDWLLAFWIIRWGKSDDKIMGQS